MRRSVVIGTCVALLLSGVAHADDPPPGNPPYEVYDLHTDHLGNIRAVTDSNGYVVAKHDLLPFGEEIMPMNDHSTKLFTGHERDDETGLDYMFARYLSGDDSRFMSVDPIKINSARRFIPQFLNLYSYVLNNPLIYVDPQGRDVFLANRPVSTFSSAGHLYILVKPSGENGQLFVDRRLGNERNGLVALGSGPNEFFRIEKALNHPFDTPENAFSGEGVSGKDIHRIEPPEGMSKQEFELAVVDAFASYNNDVNYANIPFNPGYYNSNGFAIGLLYSVGVAPASLPSRSTLEGINVGIGRPVPEECFPVPKEDLPSPRRPMSPM